MADFGVTPTGFVKKTFSVLKGEIETDERSDIDPALNLASSGVFGNINGIFIDAMRELWDVAEGVYRSLNPDFAEGDAQDQLCSLTNIRRKAPTFSSVDCVCTGTPFTPLPAGRIISVGVNGARFSSVADAVIEAGGTVNVTFEAELEGPVQAPAGTLVTIVTAVAGWASVTNSLDADPGTDLEADATMRYRRIQALAAPGDTTEAILALLKGLDGVTNAMIFENTTMDVDASGLPPKSFEAVVEGGDDVAIAAAIFSKKPAGITAYGGYTLNVTDSQGVDHVIGYSRPTEVLIYLVLTLTVNAGVFGSGDPAAGLVLVQEALVALGDQLDMGAEIVALRVRAAALTVPGVIDVPTFAQGIAPAPVDDANLFMTTRELPKFDTSRITVTVA